MKSTMILFAFALMCWDCGDGTSITDEQVNTNSENRYAEKDVTAEHGIMIFKRDMKPINGIVFSEFGDKGKCVIGQIDGLWRHWYEDGALYDEVNYQDGKRL